MIYGWSSLKRTFAYLTLERSRDTLEHVLVSPGPRIDKEIGILIEQRNELNQAFDRVFLLTLVNH
jgi:hypothetical protein